MLLLLDYIFRFIISSLVTCILTLIYLQQITLGNWKLKNFTLNNGLITFNLEFKDFKLYDVNWNMSDHKLLLGGIDINYKDFTSLINIKNINLKYKTIIGNVYASINDKSNGIISIHGEGPFDGKHKLKYSIQNQKLAFQTTGNNLILIKGLNYRLNSRNPVKGYYDIETKKALVETNDLKLNIDLNKKKLYCNSLLSYLVGKIELDYNKDFIIQAELKYLELIKAIKSILDIVKSVSHLSTKSTREYHISAFAQKCKLLTSKTINQLTTNLVISDKQIKNIAASAWMDKNKINCSSEHFNQLYIRADDAKEFLSTITSTTIVSSGQLSGSIDLNEEDKSWRLNFHNTTIPHFNTGSIRHIISPVRFIRSVLDKPDYFEKVVCTGRVDKLKILIDSVSGQNNYYKLGMRGHIDIQASRLDLKGIITSSNMINTLGEISKLDILKDVIKINISGPFSSVKFSFTMAPASILSTLLQTFIL